MKKELIEKLFLIGLVGFILFFPQSTPGYRMIPMNLVEMTSQAQRIMVGICTSRSDGKLNFGQEGKSLHYSEYTFTVSEVIKGNVSQELTIRQVRLGGAPEVKKSESGGADIEEPLGFNPIALPEYEIGKEVLLFLGKDSSLGLTSPIALEQSVFDAKTINGKKYFLNRLGNRFLFKGVSSEKITNSKNLSPAEADIFQGVEKEPDVGDRKSSDPFPSEPFVSLIRKLANGN